MYLPETNAQMFDILTELRIYAAMNGMPKLAERLDDAMMLLLAEGRNPTRPLARRRRRRPREALAPPEGASPVLTAPARAGHAGGR